jgi:Rrf2 family protein
MISQTMEYALRACVYLATEQGRACTTEQIARATRMPSAYLAKVMRQLVEADLVCAQRGIGGGFRLLKRPEDTSLLEVVSSVELPQRLRSCTAGSIPTETRMCALHKQLDDALALVERALAETALAEILTAPDRRVPLCDCARSAPPWPAAG